MKRNINIKLIDNDRSKRLEVYLTNTNVKAYQIPFDQVKSSEDLPGIHLSGIILLLGYDGEKPAFFIESAKDLYKNLYHQIDKEKDIIWDNAVVFLGIKDKKFDKMQCQYLTNKLYNEINNSAFYISWNTEEPSVTCSLSENENYLDIVLDNIRDILQILNFSLFKAPVSYLDYHRINWHRRGQKFYIDSRGIKSFGRINSDNTFILFSGSQISLKNSPKLDSDFVKMRKKLLSSGLVKDGILQEEVRFVNADDLASVVMGENRRGGSTLKLDSGHDYEWYRKMCKNEREKAKKMG